MSAASKPPEASYRDQVYILRRYVHASGLPAPAGLAETASNRRLIDKFTSYAAPLAVVAALAAPVPTGRCQRIFSVGTGSSSGPVDFGMWFSEDMHLLTSAEATCQEIAELNRLYELSADDGISLDLFD